MHFRDLASYVEVANLSVTQNLLAVKIAYLGGLGEIIQAFPTIASCSRLSFYHQLRGCRAQIAQR